MPALLADPSKHVAFYAYHLRNGFPRQYTTMAANQPTLLYFTLGGLDLLGALPKVLPEGQRLALIEKLYSLQSPDGGFHGFICEGTSLFGEPTPGTSSEVQMSRPHLANTYAALLSLLMLRDSLSRLDRAGLEAQLANWQQASGGFCSQTTFGGVAAQESDARFAFCAAACSVLANVRLRDERALVQWLHRCQTADGAFGMEPGCEGHGGTTYCSIAALTLLGEPTPRAWDVVDWCVARQRLPEAQTEEVDVGGFQGRPSKRSDSCYTFWVGAALDLVARQVGALGAAALVDVARLRGFLGQLEFSQGGFRKNPDVPVPDILHSYMALAGLAIFGEPSLGRVLPQLNIRKDHVPVAVRAAVELREAAAVTAGRAANGVAASPLAPADGARWPAALLLGAAGAMGAVLATRMFQ